MRPGSFAANPRSLIGLPDERAERADGRGRPRGQGRPGHRRSRRARLARPRERWQRGATWSSRTSTPRAPRVAAEVGGTSSRGRRVRPRSQPRPRRLARGECGGLDLVHLNAGVASGIGLGDEFDLDRYRQVRPSTSTASSSARRRPARAARAGRRRDRRDVLTRRPDRAPPTTRSTPPTSTRSSA